MGLALGVMEREMGCSMARLGVILLLGPKGDLQMFFAQQDPERVAGTI